MLLFYGILHVRTKINVYCCCNNCDDTLAQDELSSLGHIPGVDPSFLSPLTHPSTTPTTIEPPVAEEDDGCVQDIETTAIGSLEVLSLTPPPSLFRSEPVHPLQLLVMWLTKCTNLCTVCVCELHGVL